MAPLESNISTMYGHIRFVTFPYCWNLPFFRWLTTGLCLLCLGSCKLKRWYGLGCESRSLRVHFAVFLIYIFPQGFWSKIYPLLDYLPLLTLHLLQVAFELYSAQSGYFIRVLWGGQTMKTSTPLGVLDMIPLADFFSCVFFFPHYGLFIN